MPREAFEKNIPTCYHNDSLFEKLKKFCHKLKNREHKWYLCAYVDYIMNWELYGIVCYPVEVSQYESIIIEIDNR